MSVSSVQLIAGAGMLPNPSAEVGAALRVNPSITANTIAVANSAVLIAFNELIDAAVVFDEEGFGNVGPPGNVSLADDLRDLSANTVPALSDTWPEGYTLNNLFPAPVFNAINFYDTGATVFYNGNIYRAIQPTQGFLPTNAAYWAEYISQSDPFTRVITQTANYVFGEGDLSKFAQVFSTAVAYVDQSNRTLDSVDSSQVLAQSFSSATGGMDYLTTGGLNLVSSDIPLLGQDFGKIGAVINFRNLDDFGLPGDLVVQLSAQSGSVLPVIAESMSALGIDDATITALANGNNTLTSQQEKSLYTILTTVSGDDLDQCLLLLNCEVPNLDNLSQLLDLKRLLPNSYQTLVCPTPNGLEPIYKNNVTNSNLIELFANDPVALYTGPNNTNSFDTMSLIIPSGWALAIKAFVRGLSQVKGIRDTNASQLGLVMGAVETNQGLDAIANLTTPIPASVVQDYQTALGNGSGEGGKFFLSDVIGLPAGVDVAGNLGVVGNTITQQTNSGVYSGLIGPTGAYTVMLNNLETDDYVEVIEEPGSGNILGYQVQIPAGLPGTGNYPNIAAGTANRAKFDSFYGDGTGVGLIAATQAIIVNIETTQAANTEIINQNWDNIAAVMARQKTNLAVAQIDFNTLEGASRSSAMSFAQSLHEYALDDSQNGANTLLGLLANTSSLSGQSVISSLKEGRNIALLGEIGVKTDTQLG